MRKFTILVVIAAASLCINNTAQALQGGTTRVAKEALFKKLLRGAGKGTAYPFIKIYDGMKWGAKWVVNPASLEGAWQKTAGRAATVYLATTLAVLPLCTSFVCSSRDADLIADRLVQERIPAGEAQKLVIYSEGEGVQKFGVQRSSRLVFMGNDAQHTAVVPLAAYRDPVPFVDLDGAAAADGMWQVLNWDLLPDAILGTRVERSKVMEVSIAGKIAGKVRIAEEASIMHGQGIVKLADKNSEQELYAVLITEQWLEDRSAGGVMLVKQDIAPYFKFLTAEEFSASKDMAQE